MKKLSTILTIAVMIMLAASPMLSMAQRISRVQQAPEFALDEGKFFEIVNKIINWIFTILMLAVIVFIFWAAYLYLTAAGDADKVKQASTQLMYAAIAVVVAMSAVGFRALVRSITGVGV